MVIVSEIWNYINKVVFKGGVVDTDKIFNLAQLKDIYDLGIRRREPFLRSRINIFLQWNAFNL